LLLVGRALSGCLFHREGIATPAGGGLAMTGLPSLLTRFCKVDVKPANTVRTKTHIKTKVYLAYAVNSYAYTVIARHSKSAKRQIIIACSHTTRYLPNLQYQIYSRSACGIQSGAAVLNHTGILGFTTFKRYRLNLFDLTR
jgi:hypothetical protein